MILFEVVLGAAVLVYITLRKHINECEKGSKEQ